MRPVTFLISFQRLQTPHQPNPLMKSMCTSILMLRMLLTLWHGGMVTGRHACDVLEWHWTISPSQVCDHIRRGDDMFTLPPATSVNVKWIFSQGHLLLHWTISPSQVCDHIRRGDDMFTLPPATSVDVKWISARVISFSHMFEIVFPHKPLMQSYVLDFGASSA
jgi:hypothetical protein